jgi:hypothetical protein
MGAALWFATASVAFFTARFIPARRQGWGRELAAALGAAVVLGLTATALDFGGWREPDPRVGWFTAYGSWAAIGLVRLFGK